MKNRCAYLDKNHVITIKTEDVPVPNDDEALIKIAANGICGSDVHFYADGRLGNFVVDRPYIPGHEASGTVAGLGRNVKNFIIGEKVAIEPGVPCGRCPLCMGGRYNLCRSVMFFSAPPVNGTFCDYICVRADMVHKVPDSVPLTHAAFVEPAAVAVHAVNRAASTGTIAGRSGLIVGTGTIGLMALMFFKTMGGGCATCADMADNRLELAKKIGADACINVKTEKIPDAAYDIVFETAGSPVAAQTCVSAAAVGGTVVQVGWPTGNIVQINYTDLIEKELTVTSVNRYANAFPAALAFIGDGRVDPAPLITHVYDFNQTAEAFAFVKNNPDKTIKVMVTN